jgi:FKBP-type peptidyl-prolyl cis-trans isomerase (trigger factor)
MFDSYAGREPLQFIIGEGRFIKEFKQDVVGINPNEGGFKWVKQ